MADIRTITESKLYKPVVAIVFGLFGFFMNFYPFNFMIPPNKASFVFGLFFPILISLSWGWKYALLSITVGLGAQTMWFLWLPYNGWAVFVSVPLYNLWILWHGWSAKNKRFAFLNNFYIAEIPFRVFFIIMIYTVFSWAFQFNPSPWAPQMKMTSAPVDFINFVQIKTAVEAILILLAADIALHFRFLQRILLIRDEKNLRSAYIISAAMLLGIIFWIISGIADYVFHFQKLEFLLSNLAPTLADTVFLKVPPEAMITRFAFMLICVIAGLVISSYMTKYKAAQIAISSEKERLAVTLRSIGDGVITAGIDGRIMLLNREAEKLTGWTEEEAFGQPVEEVFRIINEKTREACENPVTKVLTTGHSVSLENHTALITKDGRELIIADSGAPIRSREGEIMGVVLVFRDITEKTRTEQELLKVKKLESVGVLAGGIAHDFNNILVAILGNISLAGELMEHDHNALPLLKEAEKASLKAKDLTQQLLTFSRGGEPVKVTASLSEIIRDSAGFLLRGGNISCEFNIPDDLWLVEIDTGQMYQVIQNIIINATHAMPKGGRIYISCGNVTPADIDHSPLASSRHYVKFVIRDTGTGIEPDVLDKIFDPYFSTKQKGSGLGLTITHSIIAKHLGHISVASKPGEGTAFTIYLPATPEGNLDDNPVTYEKSAAAQKGDIRIMIMDDEEMVRKVAQKMLIHLGYSVIEASDGAEAVKIYREQHRAKSPVDIIIMDLTIPGGMGGEEAVSEILSINPNAKVIVSSGYSNNPIMSDYKKYGFSAAVTKPYILEELMNVMKQVMSRE